MDDLDHIDAVPPFFVHARIFVSNQLFLLCLQFTTTPLLIDGGQLCTASNRI